MKTFSLAFLAVFALAVQLSAQSDVSKSKFKTGEIRIDGNDKDWATPLSFYDDNTGFRYSVSNDKQNIYLIFTVDDQRKMMKLMKAGWTIDLSSKEKKRKFNASLNFQGVPHLGQGYQRGSSEQENRAEVNLIIKDYTSQLPDVLLHGFQSGVSELKLNSRKDIQLGIGANFTQNLVYEIAIPLKELMVEQSIQLDEIITLEVSVNGMERPSSGEGEHRGRSGEGGGMSGGGGGQMGGGRSGGMSGRGGGRSGGYSGGRSGGGGGAYGSGNHSNTTEKASFKQKIELVGQ